MHHRFGGTRLHFGHGNDPWSAGCAEQDSRAVEGPPPMDGADEEGKLLGLYCVFAHIQQRGLHPSDA
jgi:hypothetical protein